MNHPFLNDFSKQLKELTSGTFKSPSEDGRKSGEKYEQAITQGLKRGEKNETENRQG